MLLQNLDLRVTLLVLAGLLLCLMQRVVQVNTHFTFDLNVQSSSTSGTCDPFPVAGCETYLLFCLRGMRSDRSCNIGNCPLGNHGRINENSLPSMPSISSDSPWPGSFQLYIKAMDEDLDEDDEVDFIFIDDTRQPQQGYTAPVAVTGDSSRVSVTLRYQVRCQDGYHGQDCNTICVANERCYSNGTVECVTGWESPDTHCNTPICMAGCHPVGGTCSTPGECQCNQGWGGDLCDQCTPAPGCHPVGGTCSTPGECQCNPGWGGDLCDRCTPAPGCHPVGGTCSTPGECQCNQGWGGDLCDQCTPAPGCSEVGGFCNIPGECLCHKGFGPPGVCNEAHNACDDSPCEDGATCTPELGTENYSCHCLPGYTGPDCGTDIDDAHNACDDSPCEDGAMCIPELGTESYSCHCLPGYTGHSCGIDIDDCEDVFCPENSTCEDGINSFTCVCNDGYQALNCTARSNEDSLSAAVVAGAIFGCLLLLLCVVVLCGVLPLVLLLVKRRRRQKKLASLSPSESANLYSSYKCSSPTGNYELSSLPPSDGTDNRVEVQADNPLYGGPTLTSNTAVITTNVPEASNTLHRVDNPIYGEPDENAAAVSTEASLSPNTLHKVDNPIYGEPDDNAAAISAEASLSPNTLHKVDNPIYGEPNENAAAISAEASLSPDTLHRVDNPIYGQPDENSTQIDTAHRVDNPIYGQPPGENSTQIYSEPTLKINSGASDAGRHIEAYAYTRMNNEDATGDSGPQLQSANLYHYATTGDTSTGSAVAQNYHTLDHKNVKETPPPVRMSKRDGAGYEALQF